MDIFFYLLSPQLCSFWVLNCLPEDPSHLVRIFLMPPPRLFPKSCSLKALVEVQRCMPPRGPREMCTLYSHFPSWFLLSK